MAHRPRSEMIAETRGKLIAAARKAFGTVGYAEASMDDFTAEAGLTRGALYHHFGGKKGLLEAVIMQMDAEMTERLREVSRRAPNPWDAFVDENLAYVQMALEPEIQRIVHRDGPAVLGDPLGWSNQEGCLAAIMNNLRILKREGYIREELDPEATARLLNGVSLHAAQWIAGSDDPEEAFARIAISFRALLEGLLTRANLN